ncbi:MAG: PD-(D/E)XK nuclease family protein, partial [Firmicutes bacterium]|nr:PD-(D/E)XK nuclease family protein [Bacillota bacterium]
MGVEEKILKFDTYQGALEAAIGAIKRRKVDLNVKHILLVPEKDTLKCERLLFSGGGAFDVEVYSLTRWFYKIGGGRVLSRTAAVMILKDILRAADLKCFYRSKSFSGFCVRLYDTICRFWDYSQGSGVRGQELGDESQGAGEDVLDVNGVLRLKLDDFALIMAEFKKRTEALYVGRGGITRLIAEKLKQDDFLSNTHVYAVNFDCLTRAEADLFNLIGEKAKSFTRTEVAGRPKITANTEVYKAPDIISCLKAAALRIREKARGGTPFDDMVIVAPGISFEQAKRIMDENGIPFYVDKREKLSDTRLAQYLTALFSLKRLSRREFIVLAKNPFGGVGADDADVFENYVNAFAIDYLGFASSFTLTNPLRDYEGENARLKIAERVRKKLHGTVAGFWAKLDRAKSAAEFCSAVRGFLDKACGVCSEKEKINQLLDEIKEFLPIFMGTARLIEAIKEGMAALELSRLPKTQNCVLIGDAGIFKGDKIRHVFAVGFNEGVIPSPNARDSLLTENEIWTLNKAGAELPLNEELDRQHEYELLQVFAVAETLFISYVESGEVRPSPLLYALKGEIKDIMCNDSVSERQKAAAGVIAAAIKVAGSQSAATEYLILHPETALSEAIKEASGKLFHFFHPAPPPRPLSGKPSWGTPQEGNEEAFAGTPQERNFKRSYFISNMTFTPHSSLLTPHLKDNPHSPLPTPHSPLIQKLFFKNGTVSASQLRSYFLCPYKHFADYGLKIKAKDKNEADVLDVGGATHGACEKYVLSGLDDSRLEEITEGVLNGGVYAYKLVGRQRDRLKREIIKLCQKFGENIRRGVFKPLGAEIKFGRFLMHNAGCTIRSEGGAEGMHSAQRTAHNEGGIGRNTGDSVDNTGDNIFETPGNNSGAIVLKGIDIGGITLKGSIDYADVYWDKNGEYTRIVDYKTGAAEFSEKELYYGKALQLPLYMRVMAENGYSPAAMLYFIFKEKWSGDYRFSGVYLRDVAILQAFDTGMEDENAVVTAGVKTLKSGEVRITGRGGVNNADFQAYLDYAAEVATLAVKQIEGGNIAPSPLDD